MLLYHHYHHNNHYHNHHHHHHHRHHHHHHHRHRHHHHRLYHYHHHLHRLSGTGVSGATIRMYIDSYEGDASKINLEAQVGVKRCEAEEGGRGEKEGKERKKGK